MNTATQIPPEVNAGRSIQEFANLDLDARVELVRSRIAAAERPAVVTEKALRRIDAHLDAVARETSPVERSKQFELAFEGFIAVGTAEDLFFVILYLRSATGVLGPLSYAEWPLERIESIARQVARGNTGQTIRREVVSLARTIYRSGLRAVDDRRQRALFIRTVCALNATFSVIAAAVLLAFHFLRIGLDSPWQMALAPCFGISGALFCASLRFRLARLEPPEVQLELLFRAAFGAICSVFAVLAFQFRMVPLFNPQLASVSSSKSGLLEVCGIAFASGLAAAAFFCLLERFGVAFKESDERCSSGIDNPGKADSQAAASATQESNDSEKAEVAHFRGKRVAIDPVLG